MLPIPEAKGDRCEIMVCPFYCAIYFLFASSPFWLVIVNLATPMEKMVKGGQVTQNEAAVDADGHIRNRRASLLPG